MTDDAIQPAAIALARAASWLVQELDVNDLIVRTLSAVTELLHAGAAGVLLVDAAGNLELLSATSHRVTVLEMFQVQAQVGPCVDAVRLGEVGAAVGEAQIRQRWGEVGAAIADAGYVAVHAFPLRWRGRVLGAVNTFHLAPEHLDEDEMQMGQAFADIVTLLLVQAAVPEAALADGVRLVLQGQARIEQAKGVLAYSRNVAMHEAYELMLQQAQDSGRSITEVADVIVAAGHRPPSGQ